MSNMAPDASAEADHFDNDLLERIGGERLSVGYHNPFLLNDPGLVYLVLQGRVEIYLTPLLGGQVCGPGMHVGSFRPGDLIFGAAEGAMPQAPSLPQAWLAPETTFALRAVATMGSLVYRGDMARVSGEDFDIVTVDWVDRWVSGISDRLETGARPTATAIIEADPGQDHPAGSALYAFHGDVVWVSLSEGEAFFLGQPDSPLRPGDLPVPVAGRVWLTLPAPATLNATFSPGQLRNRRLWEALPAFNARCVAVLTRRLLDEEARRSEAWSRRVAERESAFRRGVASIGGLLDPRLKFQAGAPSAPTDRLAAALRLVAEPLGLEVIEPAGEPAGVYSPLDEIARASGFGMRQVELREGWWRNDSGPILGFRDDADLAPVALLPDGPNRYRMVDPAGGADVPVTASVAAGLYSKGYMLYRPLPAEARSMWDMLRFGVRGLRPDMTVILVMGLLSAIMALLVPIASGSLMETVLPRSDYALHIAIIAALAAAAIADTTFDVTQAVAVVRLQGRMDSVVQTSIWWRLLSLRAQFFRRYTSGDLADRANGINVIREAVSGAVIQSVLGGLFSLVSVVVMFAQSWQLGLVGVGLVLVLAAITLLLFRMSLPHIRAAQQMNGQIHALVFQLLTGITKLRVGAAEGRAFARWSEIYAQERGHFYAVARIAIWQKLFTSVYPAIASAILFAVIVWLLDAAQPNSGFSIGSFVAFNGAFGQFLVGVLALVNALNTLLKVVPIWERVRPILDARTEADGVLSSPGVVSGEVRVSNLTFRYNADGPPTIDNLSMRIASGEYVAFVGASGSGKSTLLRLLLGFEDPESGAIYLDGNDLATLDMRAVRRQIGTVLQNGKLQPGSIFENIVGTAPLRMNDAWEAARLAGLAADIEAMPMGMQTVLSEGAQALSGGQRQRLLIARALVRKPRLLIFDEATSALDNRTQAEVKETLDRLSVTRIVVAHRLSTISDVHKVFVFDAGRLVESGNPKELLKTDGTFAALARRQMV